MAEMIIFGWIFFYILFTNYYLPFYSGVWQKMNITQMYLYNQSDNKQLESSFSKPGANSTHNATGPVIDINWGNLSDNMQLPLETQNTLYYFFFLTYAVLLPDTCRRTLMKNQWSYPLINVNLEFKV